MTEQVISISELESYLWGAAILLRGLIDAGDYKQYIFPLLFYKRISDVHEEEYQNAVEQSSGDLDYALFAENHRFQIPDGCHWKDLRGQATDIGRRIQENLRAIEAANPELLRGIFGDAQWTNKDRLPDALLRDLIEHFSTIELSIANVPHDELGQGYEFLIKKFADDSGHTAAEFYTNRTVVDLMSRMLDIKEGESVYDPTCGTGGMLLQAANQLQQQGKEHRTLKLYGQERNLMTSSIARMNLFLHGFEDFEIKRADTLSNPQFIENDQLMQFDAVLANPPYSISQWSQAAWESDRYGRNFLGVPPQGRADYAFFQHILKSLKPETGRCAILLPHGVLFRAEEKSMRTKLLELDLIDCVLGLGPNLFYNAPMEACVLICSSHKKVEMKSKVFFINAIDQVTRKQAQSLLEEKHIIKILSAYQARKDIHGFSRLVDLEEIKGHEFNLSIPLYIDTNHDDDSGEENTLEEVIQKWVVSSNALRTSLDDLLSIIMEEKD